MVIAHNISATNTYNKMGISSKAADKNMEKLSSGYKINRAADDAAGLSISEKMRSQIRGLNQASENAENGISMIQTAEGALNEAHSILQRMRELAVQAANDTNAASDREALQSEIDQLTSEINRIGNTTEFNGMKILNGSKRALTGKEDIDVLDGLQTGSNLNFNLVDGVVNTAELELTSDGIKFVADPSASATGSLDRTKLTTVEGKNILTISKKDGKITASCTLEDKDGIKNTYENLELVQDGTTGNWVCKSADNHGIAFALTKNSVKNFITNGEETDKLEIDLAKAKGASGDDWSIVNATYTATNDYLEGTSKNIQIANNSFALSTWSDNKRVDYDDVKIEFQNATGDGAATLNVTFYNEGNAVITDKIGLTVGAVTGTDATVKYDANGLKFDITVKAGTTATEYMGLDVDLTKYYNEKTVQGNGSENDNSVYFHVGANTNQVINTEFGDMRARALGLTGNGEEFCKEYTVNNGTDSTPTERGLNISTREGANLAIDIIDKAVTLVSQERSRYGSIQNRLEYTINNLDTTSENMTSAESTIRDVDMASEMMELTKNQILQQASQAMLTQAMQTPQQVLQLLQ